MKDWVKNQLANKDQTIKEVMGIITNAKIGAALVVDADNKLIGLLTDSDIRRAILNNIELSTPISEVMTKEPRTLKEGFSIEDGVEFMRKNRVNRVPVVDAEGVVKDLALYWKLQEALEENKDHVDFTLNSERSTTKEKVCVIGAGGYVGSLLCEELLKEGYAVRGVDRFLFGDASLKEIVNHPDFELMTGDIRNLDVLVDAAFGVDAVINLAAIVGDPACDLDVNHTIMVNYFTAKAAADAARHYKVGRYLFASTCAVYGASEGKQGLKEESPVAPVSLYAETKYRTEHGILSLADDDFSPCIFRLGTVYGLSPRMRFDLVANLFVLHAYTNKKITVFGGEQWRPYVHARDVARAMICGLKADKQKIHKQVFNLGSNEQNHRVIDLANLVASKIEGTEVIHDEGAKDQRDYFVNFDKIRDDIGFVPANTIESAVEEIKAQFDQGKFQDFKDKKYNNMLQQESLIFS